MTNHSAAIPNPRLAFPNIPALADDTPSRHPCKIRIPSAQKRFMFDPYKAQVTLGLESEEGTESSSEDDVKDDVFSTFSTKATIPTREQNTFAPQPVDPLSPITNGSAFTTTAGSPAQEKLIVNRRPSPTPAAHSLPEHNSQRGLSSATPSPPPAQPSFLDGAPSLQMPADEAFDSVGGPQQVGGAHYTTVDGCLRMQAGSMHHALVRFKFSEDVYVVPLCDRRGLCVGDLVVVEGDRGENIGQVASDESSNYSPEDMSQKQIIRRALNKDRKKFYHARRKDALASKAAQQVAQENQLKMHVLDAEFQCDLMKLTIYYRNLGAPGETIDFREIQRSLFKQFRCRIWLVNWDEDKSLQEIVSKQLLPTPHAQSSSQEADSAFLVEAAMLPRPVEERLASGPKLQEAPIQGKISATVSAFAPPSFHVTSDPNIHAISSVPVSVRAHQQVPATFHQYPRPRSQQQKPNIPFALEGLSGVTRTTSHW